MSNYQVKDNHILAEYDSNGNAITQDDLNNKFKKDIEDLKENGGGGGGLSPADRETLNKVPALESQLDDIVTSGVGALKKSPNNLLTNVKYANENKTTVSALKATGGHIVSFVGDSLFGYQARPLIKIFENSYGLNGLGFDKFGTYGNYVTISMSGITVIDDSSNVDEWGFCGRVHKGIVGSTITYKPQDIYTFDDIRIFYLKRNTVGTFRYNIDGGAWVTVDCNNANKSIGYIEHNKLRNSNSYNSTHQINIEVLSGEVYFYGIQTFAKNSYGMNLNFFSEGGTTAQQWNKPEIIAYVNQFLNIINPNQLHIWLGTNDAGTTKLDEDSFDIAYRGFVNGITNQSIKDKILYTYIPRGKDSDWTKEDIEFLDLTNKYAEKIKIFAKEKGFSVFDIHSIYPIREIAYSNGMCADKDVIHPSDIGANYIASEMSKLLGNSTIQDSISSMSNNTFKGILQGFYNNVLLCNVRYNSNGDIVYGSSGLQFTNTNDVIYKYNGIDKVKLGNYPAWLTITPDDSNQSILYAYRSNSTTAWALDVKIIGSVTNINTNNGDVVFQRSGTEVMKISNLISFGKPTVMNKATTTLRPTVEEGTFIYDTTLKKPIYFDGANWRDFTGANV